MSGANKKTNKLDQMFSGFNTGFDSEDNDDLEILDR